MKTQILSWLEGPSWAIGAALLLWVILALVLRLIIKRKESGVDETEAPYPCSSTLQLQKRINEGQLAVRTALIALIATPIVFSLGYAAFLYIRPQPNTTEGIGVVGILGAAMWGWSCLGWRRAGQDLKMRQWVFDAKAMVAKHVLDLKERGYTVFSDCRLNAAAFDHILIGPKGVFTVQTFVGSSAYQADLNAHATVTYDGRTLFFPSEENHESVEQACREAEMLSEWLSQTLEAPLAARAVVALPGWQVKRTSPEGISVINPTQFEALFQYIRPRPLSTAVVDRLTDQVRQHCSGDTEPFSAPTPFGETADIR